MHKNEISEKIMRAALEVHRIGRRAELMNLRVLCASAVKWSSESQSRQRMKPKKTTNTRMKGNIELSNLEM